MRRRFYKGFQNHYVQIEESLRNNVRVSRVSYPVRSGVFAWIRSKAKRSAESTLKVSLEGILKIMTDDPKT